MAGPAKFDRWYRRAVIGIPNAWLIVFLLLPLLIVLRISVSQPELAQPPYTPVLDLSAGWQGMKDFFGALSFENFALLFGDWLYVSSYLRSLTFAAISTLILLAIGIPIAYGMARSPRRLQPVLLVAVILPFWTAFLIRIYAWINILQRDGPLNDALLALGIVSEPLTWLATDTAIFIGIVYSYLPFMVLPLYASFEKMDDTLLEAAADLGCRRWKAFWLVTLPLALPGVIAGSLLCFIGQTLWMEFFSNKDWPVASALATVLLAILLVPIIFYQAAQARALEHE